MMQELSTILWNARAGRAPVPPLTKQQPELAIQTAYEIAWDGMKKRQDQGEQIIGYKMGLTSRAKREQMQLKEAIYGILTDAMRIEGEDSFKVATGIHPKAEPEIAFHLTRPLTTLPTPEDVYEVCDLVAPAIEILDSRFEGFKYFSLPDVIADNSSSSHFLVGNPIRLDLFPHWQDLANIQMDFFVNGSLKHQAKASEISGNPILSVVELCKLFLSQGRTVPANCWILAGAATPAVALEPGMEITLTTDKFDPVVLKTK